MRPSLQAKSPRLVLAVWFGLLGLALAFIGWGLHRYMATRDAGQPAADASGAHAGIPQRSASRPEMPPMLGLQTEKPELAGQDSSSGADQHDAPSHKPDSKDLSQRGTIFGKITRESDGTAVAGATVRVYDEAVLELAIESRRPVLDWPPAIQTATTDENGDYIAAEVPPGRLRVVVFPNGQGLAAACEEVALKREETQRVDMSLRPGYSLSGLVTDIESGRLLKDAQVTALPDAMSRDIALSAKTDERGFYEFTGLPEDWTLVYAYLDGYVDTNPERGIAIAADAENKLDIQLARPATVAGRVTDKDDRPIGSALINASIDVGDNWISHWRITETNENGEYLILGLQPGTAVITAAHPKYETGMSEKFQLEPGEVRAGVNVTLHAIAFSSVSGKVMNEKGVPVSRATVAVWERTEIGSSNWQNTIEYWDRAMAVTTDEDGKYKLEGLRPGRRRLTAQATGYAISKRENITIEAGANVSDVDFVLGQGLAISGTVRDQERNPVAGALVRALTREEYFRGRDSGSIGASTDENGRYEIVCLAPEDYYLTATAEGHESSARVDVPAGTSSADIVLRKRCGIAGVVTNWLKGETELRARALLPCWSPRWVSFESVDTLNGKFRLEVREAGTYTVELETENHGRGRVEGVVVRLGEITGGVEVTLKEGAATIAGRVVSRADGKPIAGAQAALVEEKAGSGEETLATIETGEDGRFAFGGLHLGLYTLNVSRAGFAPWKETITVTEGKDTSDITVNLSSGGIVRGTVVGTDGQPKAGHNILLYDKTQSFMKETTCDDSGRFEFLTVPQGFYTLRCEVKFEGKCSGKGRSVELQVVEGETTEVSIMGELEGRCRLYGVVLRQGKPYTEAYVTARKTASESGKPGSFVVRQVCSDQYGKYAIPDIEPGRYIIGVDDKNPAKWLCPHETEVNVGHAAEQQFDIVFPDGLVAGCVRDAATGRPIAGADVSLAQMSNANMPPDAQAKLARRLTEYSDASGVYLIDAVPDGAYTVHAHARGFARATANAQVTVGSKVEGVNFSMTAGGALSGCVRDSSDAAVSQARVSLRDSQGALVYFGWLVVETDDYGKFTCPDLRPGTYDVTLLADGYATGATQAAVREREETKVSVTLRKAE